MPNELIEAIMEDIELLLDDTEIDSQDMFVDRIKPILRKHLTPAPLNQERLGEMIEKYDKMFGPTVGCRDVARDLESLRSDVLPL